jgi:hypothetical protein
MSQFPIDNNSDIVESVNYLLSGPTSIGQNFEGMSAVGVNVTVSGGFGGTTQTYLTGMPILGPAYVLRPPEEQPGTVDNTDELFGIIYNDVYPIWNTVTGGLSVVGITPITATGRKIYLTVDTTFAGVSFSSKWPFVLGQQVVLSGITPSSYNGTYTVLEPTGFTDPDITVMLISDTAQTWPAYTSGGTLKINDNFSGSSPTTQRFFTGNQAIVTVTGPTDRVFISSQMNNLILFTYIRITTFPPGGASFTVQLEINRYRAVQKTTLPDTGVGAIYSSGTAYNGYLWEFDKTIVSVPTPVNYTLGATSIATNNFGNVIYNNVIDNPGIGTYLYAFQISQNAYRDGTSAYPGTQLIIGAQTTGVRSFTAQAIKR